MPTISISSILKLALAFLALAVVTQDSPSHKAFGQSINRPPNTPMLNSNEEDGLIPALLNAGKSAQSIYTEISGFRAIQHCFDYMEEGDTSAYIACLRKLEQEYRDLTVDSILFEVQQNLVTGLIAQGQIEEAKIRLEHLSNAIEQVQDPSSVERERHTLELRAIELDLAMGKGEIALGALTDLAAKQGTAVSHHHHSFLQILWVEALVQSGRYEEALVLILQQGDMIVRGSYRSLYMLDLKVRAELASGDLLAALDTLEDMSRQSQRADDTYHLARSMLYRAQIFTSRGEEIHARDAWEQAYLSAQNTDVPWVRINAARGWSGQLMRDQKSTEALAVLEESYHWLAGRDLPRLNLILDVAACELHKKQGQSSKALEVAEVGLTRSGLLEVSPMRQRLEACALTNAALLEDRKSLKHHYDALEVLLLTQKPTPATILQVHAALGLGAKSLGDLKASLNYYWSALEEADHLRLLSPGSAWSRTGSSGDYDEVVDALVSLEMELGHPLKAVAALERQSARALGDLLYDGAVNLDLSISDRRMIRQIDAQLAALNQRTQRAESSRRSFSVEEGGDLSWATQDDLQAVADQQELSNLLEQRSLLMLELETRATANRRDDMVSPYTAQALRRLPSKGELMLTWHLSEDEIYVMAWNQNEATALPLGIAQSELEKRIEDFRVMLDPLAPASISEVEEASRALGLALLGPIDSLLIEADTVTVFPRGALHRLPIAALTTPSNTYLGLGWPLSQAPSATALGLLRQGIDGLELQPALAVGDPATGLQRLPKSLQEAKAVASILGPETKLLVEEEATDFAVTAALKGAKVALLATHGTLLPQAPRESWLAFAPRGGDGRLSVQEVLEMSLEAEVLFLSACETGLGIQVGQLGDEQLGLATAFHIAGARRVIASLWLVDDSATGQLSEAFFSSLADGVAPALALTQARQVLVSKADKTSTGMASTAHPAFWAAFYLSGPGSSQKEDNAPEVTVKTAPELSHVVDAYGAQPLVVPISWAYTSLRIGLGMRTLMGSKWVLNEPVTDPTFLMEPLLWGEQSAGSSVNGIPLAALGHFGWTLVLGEDFTVNRFQFGLEGVWDVGIADRVSIEEETQDIVYRRVRMPQLSVNILALFPIAPWQVKLGLRGSLLFPSALGIEGVGKEFSSQEWSLLRSERAPAALGPQLAINLPIMSGMQEFKVFYQRGPNAFQIMGLTMCLDAPFVAFTQDSNLLSPNIVAPLKTIGNQLGKLLNGVYLLVGS